VQWNPARYGRGPDLLPFPACGRGAGGEGSGSTSFTVPMSTFPASSVRSIAAQQEFLAIPGRHARWRGRPGRRGTREGGPRPRRYAFPSTCFTAFTSPLIWKGFDT
jgi:hypothetical protein